MRKQKPKPNSTPGALLPCCSAALVGPDPLLGSEMQFLPAVRLIACLELLATLFDAFCHKPNSAEAHFRCHN